MQARGWFADGTFRARFGGLYLRYEDRFAHWEMLVLLRRLLLVLVLVWASQYMLMQAAMMLAVLFVALVLQAWHRIAWHRIAWTHTCHGSYAMPCHAMLRTTRAPSTRRRSTSSSSCSCSRRTS
jgi:hypothetical protein